MHLFISIAISYVVYVWLRTNAFVDYFGWLLKPRNIFYVKDYLKSPLFPIVEYPIWLYTTYPKFLTKLLSCPLCCTFWLNLIFASSFTAWFFDAYLSLVAFILLDKLNKRNG